MERMVMTGMGGENACPLLDSYGHNECPSWLTLIGMLRVCLKLGTKQGVSVRGSQSVRTSVWKEVGSSVADRFTLGLSAGDSPRDTRSMAKSNCMQAKYIQWST